MLSNVAVSSLLVLGLVGSGAQAQSYCQNQIETIRVDLGYGDYFQKGVSLTIDYIRRGSSELTYITNYLRNVSQPNAWQAFDLNREINEQIDREVLPGMQQTGNALINIQRAMDAGDLNAARALVAEAQRNQQQAYSGAIRTKSIVDNLQRRVNSSITQFRNDFAGASQRADRLAQDVDRLTREADYKLNRVRDNLNDYVRSCSQP